MYVWKKIPSVLWYSLAVLPVGPMPPSHQHFKTNPFISFIWVVQENPSQQGWPRCVTDDSKKGIKRRLPFSICKAFNFMSAHNGSSGWAKEAPHHTVTIKNSQKGKKGSKPCFPVPHSAEICVCQRRKNHSETGFLAPPSVRIHSVEFESQNLRMKYEQ